MSTSYHHGDLRRALLERAIETVNEGGVEALSLRALARDLGVSHAAPLRHFATKADLLNAVAVEGVQRLIAATEDALEVPTARERLWSMSHAYVAWAIENAALHRVIRNPDVTRHASDELKALLSDFAARQSREVRRAQKEGWRVDQDPEVLFLHLVSLTAGTAIVATDETYREPVGGVLLKDMVAASLDLFLG